jgi:PAS domain S-box-containing protein
MKVINKSLVVLSTTLTGIFLALMAAIQFFTYEAERGFGIVAKMDITDFQRLHLVAPILISIIAIALASLGVLLVSRLYKPVFERLEHSEAHHRTIFETVAVGIVIINDKGVIQSVNSTAQTLFGYPADEVCGQNVTMLMPEPDASKHDGYLERYLTTGEKKIIGIGRMVRGKRKNGLTFPMDLAVSEMKIDGEVMFIGIMRDITEHIEANKEVRQLKTTLDLTQDGVFMFYPDTLKFFYTNLAASEQLGYSEEEFLTMTPLDIKPEFSEQSFREMVAPLIAGSRHVHIFQTMHQHRNGSLVPVEVILQYLAPEGEPARFSAVVRDITERRKADEELLAAKETAELATHSKAAFLANMSHEIRTPMNGVLGMLELLQLTDLGLQQKGYVATASESAVSLLAIVNDVLDFSKIEAGQMALEDISLDPHKLVQQTVTLLASMAAAKGVELNCFISPQAPVSVAGDPTRLRQVLLNLLSNAIKFTDQGEVNLSVAQVEETMTHVYLRFVVKDTGIGIPTEKQEDLFAAFTQADSSTTRRFGGTGLGLSISRQLVQLMGGELSVDSAAGRGSKFWFTAPFGKRAQPVAAKPKDIPDEAIQQAGFDRHLVKPVGQSDVYNALLHHPEEVEKSPPPAVSVAEVSLESISSLKGFSVLLADDVAINQLVCREMLGKMGIEVDVVDDGRQAVDAVARIRYDLVLMDCQMPVMDGYRATGLVRAREQALGLPHLPIIAMTAHAMEGDRETCIAAGMDDYVSKPFRFAALQQTLANWLLDEEGAAMHNKRMTLLPEESDD